MKNPGESGRTTVGQLERTKQLAEKVRALDDSDRKILADEAEVSLKQIGRIGSDKPPEKMRLSTIRRLETALSSLQGSSMQEASSLLPSVRSPDERAEDSAQFWSMILEYAGRGMGAATISKKLAEDHGVLYSSNDISRAVWAGVRARRLQYIPDIEDSLTRTILTKYSWLKDARVVNTLSANDIGRVGAEMLCRILSNLRDTTTARIGFWGGNTPGIAAEYFARLLRQPGTAPAGVDMTFAKTLKKLAFHSLIGNLSGREPRVDPNLFFLPFTDSMIATEFHYLPVPGIVTREDKDLLERFTLYQVAKESTQDLQVLVSSAGHFDCTKTARYFLDEAIGEISGEGRSVKKDHYSNPRERLARAWNETVNQLKAKEDSKQCIGDLMWHWVSDEGLIERNLPLEIMTSLNLKQVGNLVKKNHGAVLLMIGPCSGCKLSKSRLLRVILERMPDCVTHLVCDHRSATKMLQGRSD
jgi:hypothetical protein